LQVQTNCYHSAVNANATEFVSHLGCNFNNWEKTSVVVDKKLKHIEKHLNTNFQQFHVKTVNLHEMKLTE